jgi:DNA-binding XRE family transcriptional regulator
MRRDANISAKVENIPHMKNEVVGNYIRAHRRRCGLSQRQLGKLIGYEDGCAVGRHERSNTVPPLLVALAYEAVFGIPVAQLFWGFKSAVAQSVAHNMQELKNSLESGAANRRQSHPERTQWLVNQHIPQ